MITEQIEMTISKSAKLIKENIVEKKNVIIDGDQEKTKMGVVMDNMLIDSHIDLEGNNMKSNNIVKRGNKFNRNPRH